MIAGPRSAKARRPPAPISIAMPAGPSNPGPPTSREPRPWLGIYFNCCNVYGRIYKRADARLYVGRCPKCGVSVTVPVGPSGTHARFFETT